MYDRRPEKVLPKKCRHPKKKTASAQSKPTSKHYSMMAPTPSHLRSLYRSLLRELPHRPLSSPSPIQLRIRSSIIAAPPHDATEAMEQGEQFVQFAKAQRMYATLLERYNPGMSMDEEDKVRLTARRVGMDLPKEWNMGKKD